MTVNATIVVKQDTFHVTVHNGIPEVVTDVGPSSATNVVVKVTWPEIARTRIRSGGHLDNSAMCTDSDILV